MTELEQKLADAFRRNGDRLLSTLPDWPNSEIVFGDAVDLARSWIIRRPPLCRHAFTLTVDGMLRVQDFGVEAFKDSVLVDVEVVSDKKADGGPIHYLTGFRKIYDQVGWSHWYATRAADGTMLYGRRSGNSRSARSRDLTSIRKLRRGYDGIGPIDWTAIRHPTEMSDGEHVIREGRLVGVWSVYEINGYNAAVVGDGVARTMEERQRMRVVSTWIRDGHVGDGVPEMGEKRALVDVDICRAKDGVWVEGGAHDLREYEARIDAVAPLVEADPEAAFLSMF